MGADNIPVSPIPVLTNQPYTPEAFNGSGTRSHDLGIPSTKPRRSDKTAGIHSKSGIESLGGSDVEILLKLLSLAGFGHPMIRLRFCYQCFFFFVIRVVNISGCSDDDDRVICEIEY